LPGWPEETIVDLRRSARILRKDLQLGPRSPLLLWAMALPLLLTLLIRGVFGGLFTAEPRLGIVDLGASELTALALELPGIEVTLLADEVQLRTALEAGDLDAGLVLPPGFDAAVRGGERPPLPLLVAGRAYMSDRILLAITALDLVRGLEGSASPVDVVVVRLGEPAVPFDLALMPLVVMMAVAIAGAMVPAAGLVEEREKGTLQAVLATPATMGEFLIAKGALGLLLALTAGTMTLGLNGVLTTAPVVALLGITLGGLMMVQLGLIVGAWAPDTNTLFAAWKAGGLVLVFPVLVFVWPAIPAWVARIGPTYYFLHPVYAATLEGATLRDVGWELGVATLLCLVLLPATAATGRWLEGRLGGTAARQRRGRKVTPAPSP
jgi:ABC-2 type transport system permease protein